jgi:hypothetical protein
VAHFAKVINNTVTNVIFADLEFFDTFVDNSPGRWIKTSYNIRGGVYYNSSTGQPVVDQSVINGDEARERKNYAGIGFKYDGTGFYPPQPYDSWTLNSSTYLWEAPLDYPTDGKVYGWNESAYQTDNTTGWVEIL